MLKQIILFTLGGILYLIIELLWRGSSHWSMYLLGGACFSLIGLINEHSHGRIPLILQMAISAVLITALEFLTGYILNIRLGLDVWDYSHLKFNIMGQISLRYTILWFFLSLVCILADDWFRTYMFGEERQKYKLI